MSQDAIAVIEKLKDLDWRPLYRTLDNGEKGYLLGYPVELTDVMPSWSIGSDTPFIVFGSLKFFNIWIKRWFTFEMWYKSWDWEKDIKSLKASARVCWLSLVDEAFSVIKTASWNSETNPETPAVNDPETNDSNDAGD
jgi:HK97 family phage major capsid protein